MVELSVIRDLVAIFGVIAGFSYYVLTVRNNQKNQELMLKAQQQTLETRKIGLTDSIIARSITLDFLRCVLELLGYEWNDYEDFEKKYGSESNVEASAKRYMVWNSYNSMGMMLRKGMVEAEDIFDAGSPSVFLWIKYKDVIEENRRRYNGTDYLMDFEYLSNEMLKLKQIKDPSFRVPETLDKYVPDK
jgi:hypothetical protein